MSSPTVIWSAEPRRDCEDHSDVVRAHLVLQPETVRLGDDGAARVEGIGELEDHVAHALVGQELPHAVGGEAHELVLFGELLPEQLRLRGHADALRHRVADGASEGAAGEALARRPYARRVAPVVELLAEVDAPVLVVGDDALQLVARHDHGA